MPEPLLRIEKLKKYFPVAEGLLFARVTDWVKAVDEISFNIDPHETFALVGESGCGKTTTARLILLLLRPTSGFIWFHGQDIARLNREKLKEYRTSIRAVFQDPYSSLDPRMRVDSIITEPLRLDRATMSKRGIRERVEEVLFQVGLEPANAELYPHEFSGGQRQRIALARALVSNPKLVVLDEPVSGLDVSIRAQVMNLLKDLQSRLGVAYLLIAHHLGTVRYISHRVAVMYLGKIVEMAPSEELFTHPMHPYTEALLSAALPSHPDIQREEIVLPGEVPSPINIPTGCRFYPRCFRSQAICVKDEPALKEVANEHWVACY
ncbi:ABC transporter ATP-binding protein [Chloroflexota bacterium]